MAEEFRHALFQTSNIVHLDPQDRNCIICFQETGTMSPETGLSEVQIRLPCGHIVGSGCIAVWLKDNNSCPMCRREFFRAQPQPLREHDAVRRQEEEEDQEEEDLEEDESRQDILESNCRSYCMQLNLDRRTIEIAWMLIRNLLRSYPFSQAVSSSYDDNAVRLVALSVYIASFLTGHPRSPREICRVRDINGGRIQDSRFINGDHVRSLYSSIYRMMEELIDDRILEALEGHPVGWPSENHYDGSDHQIECRRDLQTVRTECVNGCRYLELHSPIDDLAQHIAANLVHTGFRAYGYPENSRHLSLVEVSAVSIYIASHLVGRPIARRVIQSLIGDEYPDVRSTYRVVRRACNQLVNDIYLETLDVMLSWETLEADVRDELNGGRLEDIDEAVVMQGQATREASATSPRPQLILRLCAGYCSRLDGPSDHRTWLIAKGLCERFDALPTFASHCPESIAAACVYIACVSTNRSISYEFLRAATELSMISLLAAHARMVEEINSGRVNTQDLAHLRHNGAIGFGDSLAASVGRGVVVNGPQEVSG